MATEYPYICFLIASNKALANKVANAFDDAWNNPFDGGKIVRDKTSKNNQGVMILCCVSELGKTMLEQLFQGVLHPFLAGRGITQADIDSIKMSLRMSPPTLVQDFTPIYLSYLDSQNLEVVE